MQVDLESVKRVLLELKDEARRMRKEQMGSRLAPKPKEGMGQMMKGDGVETELEEEMGAAEVDVPGAESEEASTGIEDDAAEADPAAASGGATGSDEDVKLLFQKLGLRR